MKQHRTAFPDGVDFSDWWVKSKKGSFAILSLNGRDLYERFVYSLKHRNGQIGNGQFSVGGLIGGGATLRLNREDFDE